MESPRFRIFTLGCKLNAFDSESLAQGLIRRGFRFAREGEAPQLVIINTCTVTGKADRESRYQVRRWRRAFPGCFLAVLGCAVDAASQETGFGPEVNWWGGNREKVQLDSLVAAFHAQCAVSESAGTRYDGQTDEVLGVPHLQTRPLVRIQDGCDGVCSYCIVPSVRGPSRSVPSRDILKQLRVLDQAGCGEAVLTGIHIGAWGCDLTPRMGLVDLMDQIQGQRLGIRLRLSSLDGHEIDDQLISRMAHDSQWCPHLHISLQSGDDEVLRAMRRPHRVAAFRKTRDRILSAMPDAALGVDLIVGFPGETDAAFENCFNLLSEGGLAYLHVFPFSPRPGTHAATLSDTVPRAVIQGRARRLRELSDHLRARFLNRFQGTIRRAVMLKRRSGSDKPVVLTDNYLHLSLDRPLDEAPRILSVRVRLDANGKGIAELLCGEGHGPGVGS